MIDPLSAIAKNHDINIHLYADDTQLYVSFDPENSEVALGRLEACLEDIRLWMEENFLKLNDSKTEFVIFGAPQDIARVTGWTVTIGDAEILPSKSARNIGAYMDVALNMRSQINNTIRACYAQLRAISKIRKHLTVDATKMLVHAFITSRLDNLNSLLYKVPDCLLRKLQLVQNNAARLITRKRKADHITPTLISLHWLPITYRIQYKLLLLIFKCLLRVAPSYLTYLIHLYKPTCALRSSSKHLLIEPTPQRKYGARAFAICGPQLWNSLPLPIRQCQTISAFKTVLKTYLFKQGYSV